MTLSAKILEVNAKNQMSQKKKKIAGKNKCTLFKINHILWKNAYDPPYCLWSLGEWLYY